MIKSFKVMLVPNNHQRTRLFQFTGTARFAYNWALRKEIGAYETGGKFISNFDLRKEFTVLRNSAKYPWLRTISNNVQASDKRLRRRLLKIFQKADATTEIQEQTARRLQLLSGHGQNPNHSDARQT